MGKAKKWIAAAVTVALVAGGAYKGADYLRARNAPEAIVVDVSELMIDDYYFDFDSEEGGLSGSIATNVIQNIKIDKDIIVGSLPVEVGDPVKKGDLLMTIDTTVTQMELGLQDLQLQQYQKDLDKANNRLYSLQHGGPIDEPDTSDTTDSSDSTDDTDYAYDVDDGYDEYDVYDDSYDDDSAVILETAGLFRHLPFLAFAFPSVLAAEVLDGDDGELSVTGEEPAPVEAEGGSELNVVPATGGNSDSADPETDEILVPEEEPPSDTDLVPDEEEELIIDEIITEDELIIEEEEGELEPIDDSTDEEIIEDITPSPEPEESDGDVFYSVLDYDSVPYEGDGSFEFPYAFFVSYDNEDEGVTLTGAFKNRMLGYNADGTELLHEGGYWYVLEFHQDDKVEDYNDRTLSLLGYYLINGGEDIEKPVDPEEKFIMTLEGAEGYSDEDEEEEEEYGDDTYDDYDYTDETEASMTRDEAIKLVEEEIKSLEYNIKAGEVELRKLQKLCEMTEIRARIDGTVSYVGNPDAGTNSMESFLRVKSEEGYFVRGSVSEMLLDQISEGTIVRCTTDFGEEFEAKVIDVSEYPEDSSSGYDYYYSGNPNASNYSFTASIEDQDIGLSEDTYLMSVVLPSSEEKKDKGITISKAFVRSENGQSYVMKDDEGVLKKQYVQVGKVDSYGYSITISGGLRQSDKLAFPYSENAVNGTRTVEGTLDDLYGYDDSLF